MQINSTSAETLIPIGLGNAKSHQHLKATEQLEITAEGRASAQQSIGLQSSTSRVSK